MARSNKKEKYVLVLKVYSTYCGDKKLSNSYITKNNVWISDKYNIDDGKKEYIEYSQKITNFKRWENKTEDIVMDTVYSMIGFNDEWENKIVVTYNFNVDCQCAIIGIEIPKNYDFSKCGWDKDEDFESIVNQNYGELAEDTWGEGDLNITNNWFLDIELVEFIHKSSDKKNKEDSVIFSDESNICISDGKMTYDELEYKYRTNVLELSIKLAETLAANRELKKEIKSLKKN